MDYWLSHWAPVDVTKRTGWDFLIKGLREGADAAGGRHTPPSDVVMAASDF